MPHIQWLAGDLPVQVEVSDPAALRPARRIVNRELAGLRRALGRDLAAVHRAAGRPVTVGPRLADLVAIALDVARRTGGAVDPTVGVATLRFGPRFPVCGAIPTAAARSVGYEAVELDGLVLRVPPTVLLDLRATATARTADRCAAVLAARTSGGLRVALGEQVSGGPASGGWTVVRAPERILDPATGRPADRVWRAVAVAAGSCVNAKALAVGAVVQGRGAEAWLRAAPLTYASLTALDGHRAEILGHGPMSPPA